MSESVEQAALRRADLADLQGRARREAVAILEGVGASAEYVAAYRHDTLINLLAIAWLQGTIYGNHETLTLAEQAFDKLRAAL